ncbi:phenylalanine--tRNA ligase subunit beta [Pseudohoeflea coraliihabitans]|uniref:Phenylalanine--tRNA ligase beta subunit n=1 Tax=Pseudohoeflea coraliihabitans TaxID=2860393 RepID=A0ABS6WNY0_9HYPH|nr:phenylalanine--tRNA ligase subunit beta [Pseudohoeflea sp. DP4N28-3]MBW3097681.1 phenylalanine--tRNA ligase subunit beta [Pseudohoeflea sp. DP4N28-3]
MKFTLSWLKDHLETDATLNRIVETLTMIGLEVEAVDDKAAFRPFTIARVVSAEPHPDADKLQILKVDAGPDCNNGAPVQVVCGAPNARTGLIGAFAAPGTYVPGIDITLGAASIRGVESFGMMCSERELQMSDNHEGIIDLPDDAPVGTSFAAYAGLDDPVIEIGLTPNRPDCTGVSGIARDLAAAGLGRLKSGAVEAVSDEGDCPVDVRLEAPELCPGFALRLVRDVRNGPSPAWMQQRLMAIGMRPINALVDITNYVTFDRGRPLHVFDARKVEGNLVVRRALEGEELLALDGRDYQLGPDNCVIADDRGVESIAGIIGGAHTGCDETTTDVLIESALWDPMNVARSGRDLGIITDARYRFERGVDPEFMVPGLDLATHLVTELCGGSPTKAQVVLGTPTATDGTIVGSTGHHFREVDFPLAETRRLTGLDVGREASIAILGRLGFAPRTTDNANSTDAAASESVRFIVPSWRPDVEGKADLVEEVMRIHGVNEIAPVPLPSQGSVGTRILTTLQIRSRLARRALAARGMAEAVTWSFIPHAHAKAFGGGKPALALSNPISADMSDMRPSLLPGLLAAAGRNADRGFGDVAMFEVAGTYESDNADGQRRVAGGIRRGTATLTGSGRDWNAPGETVGVFDAKADAFAALEACGAPVGRLQVTRDAPDWYHPGRSGAIKLGPKAVLGYFGEFHPAALEALDVTGPLCGFEIFIDAIPEPRRKATRTKPVLSLSPFQAVRRDFAFVVGTETAAGDIVRAAAGADKQMVSDVKVFDIFEGESLGTGRKSVAIEVTLQPRDRTLTDEDLDRISAAIVGSVEKATGGTLRN